MVFVYGQKFNSGFAIFLDLKMETRYKCSTVINMQILAASFIKA